MPVQLLIPGCAPAPRAELSQWFTPPDLARRVVEWAGVKPGDLVLEPSAGSGALVRPLLAAGCAVRAVELDPAWAAYLREQHQGLDVACADFMAWGAGLWFDACVMNPPFEDNQDLTHVERALSLCARVVAVVRLNFLSGVERRDRIWSRAWFRRLVVLSRRPSFSGAGSPKHDFAVIELLPAGDDRKRAATRMEFWV